MRLAISMGSTANGRGLCDRVFQICKITCPKIGKSLHDENIPIIIKNSIYLYNFLVLGHPNFSTRDLDNFSLRRF